jgi:hypothetical protein
MRLRRRCLESPPLPTPDLCELLAAGPHSSCDMDCDEKAKRPLVEPDRASRLR